MRRLLRVCREIVRLARPYLFSGDRLAASLLLAAILALTVANVGLGLLISFSQRLFYTALQEKNAAAFIRALFWFTIRPGRWPVPPFILFVTANITTACLSLYLQAVLQLRWQRWLTARVVGQWLSDHAYYRLPLLRRADDSGTDNPDQRIQEDIEDATRNVIAFSTGFLSSVGSVVSFGGLLWALSGPFTLLGLHVRGYLLWTALLYAAACTVIAHLAGRSIAEINFVRQRFRGDFRVSLVRVRENAEQIAFLRGEPAEAASIAARFTDYYRTALRLVLRTSGLTFLSNMSAEMAIVFPTVIAAPRFFAGQISFGTLNQIRLGFLQLAEAALWFVSTYAELAEFVSQIERLSTLQAALLRVASEARTLEVRRGAEDCVTLSARPVLEPAGSVLLPDIAFEIPQGSNTAITGGSGAGKTTLFRILAGFWTHAAGSMSMPSDGVIFVPQRAYFPEGTLRRALCYPTDPAIVRNEEIGRVLALSGLPALAASLDVADAWERRLSPGQRQRLALARAILQRPRWLFLDEPTSSLPPAARVALHAALARELPGTTLVIITHDPDVVRLQQHRIEIGPRLAA